MARKGSRFTRSERSKSAALAADGEALPASPSLARDLSLKNLVFSAGAVLMGLEIAGSRILAPHFGNSVFVWGSLITVFLVALSLGYLWGGRLADRRPSQSLLSLICIGVAVWIFGLSLVSASFCEYLVLQGAGEQSGPLLAAAVLFLPPSVGMGVVSPFAIRLATPTVATVGQIAGTLYALSTAGSIAGTMLTTFVLIPLVGLTLILRGLAVVLLLAAVLALVTHRRSAAPAAAAGVIAAGIVLLLPAGTRTPLYWGQTLVYEADTPYHNISVVDDDNSYTRQLRFDRYIESEIDLEEPYESRAEYTNFFHLAFLLKPDIDRSLFIGAGGGVGPRAFHLHRPEMEIDVVDIDPQVLEVARDYFYLPQSRQIQTIARDGRIFVRSSGQSYDCILLDAFTIGGRIPFHLVTREFFTLCRRRMTDDGVFVMNINSALTGPSAPIFRSVYRTLSEVFPTVYVFANEHRYRGREQSTNILFVATTSRQRISPAEWQSRAAEYESPSYVGRPYMLAMVQDLVADVPDVASAPLLTDDYAPIETMPF